MYTLFFMDCSQETTPIEKNLEEKTIENHDIGRNILNILSFLEGGTEPKTSILNENKNRDVLSPCNVIVNSLSDIDDIPGKIFFIIISSYKSECDCYSDQIINNIRGKREKDPIIKITNFSSDCMYNPLTGVIDIPTGYIHNEEYYDKLSELLDFILYPPKIYISYGNRDEHGIGDYINQIKESFNKVYRNVEIYYDRSDIEHGDYIDEFMMKLKNSDYLISLMNKRYFESIDCMDEFYGFYNKFGLKKIELFKRKFISIIMKSAEGKIDGMGNTKVFWRKELLEKAKLINIESDKKKIRDARIIVQTLEETIGIFEDYIMDRRNEGDTAMLKESFATIINKINTDINDGQGFLTYYNKKSDIRDVLQGVGRPIKIRLNN